MYVYKIHLFTCILLCLISLPACTAVSNTQASLADSGAAQSGRLTNSFPSPADAEALPGPRALPVNQPRQITFSSAPVTGLDIAKEKQILVFSSKHEDFSRIWLGSSDPGQVLIPQMLLPQGADQYDPAISPNGKWIAFAGNSHDVKGDIYLMPAKGPPSALQRITGRSTADRGPCFSANSERLYFHQSRPGEEKRFISYLDFKKSAVQIKTLDLGVDAAFPALSPDGKQLAFVSAREDAGSDIYISNTQGQESYRLTAEKAEDSFPSWSPAGESIYFSRSPAQNAAQNNVFSRSTLYRKKSQADSLPAMPLTSQDVQSSRPIVTADALYYLSSRTEVDNVWSLPLQGRIAEQQNIHKQWELARDIAQKLPQNDYLTVLGYLKLVQLYPRQTELAAQAAYFAGLHYEHLGLTSLAEATYNLIPDNFSSNQLYLGLALVRLKLLTAHKNLKQAVTEKEQEKILQQAEQKLQNLFKRFAQSRQIVNRIRIEQARLLADLGQDSASLQKGLELLDKALDDPHTPNKLLAEAMLLRADLFARLQNRADLTGLYLDILKRFPQQEKWVDLAVERILDLQLADQDFSGQQTRQKVVLFTDLATEYEDQFPRLAMGALNRAGDLYYQADKWSQAKAAYRQVLDNFPVLQPQTAAAKLSLAEIFYGEERFQKALDIYSTQMDAGQGAKSGKRRIESQQLKTQDAQAAHQGLRTYADRLYRLASQAYKQKALQAADYHFRLGEIPLAKNMYYKLMQKDYFLVQAHRGYIRCAAAQAEIPSLLDTYQGLLNKFPQDPTTLYALGLCLTYKQDHKSLERAQGLIQEAIKRKGQVQYFHQTLGYIFEVLETVHNQKGLLEKALTSYRKAYFLNLASEDEKNRAHLLLNLGNAHFLLQEFAQAFDYYSRRQESDVAFSSPDAKLLFLRRFGTSAFHIREQKAPVQAFSKALNLLDQRMQPLKASRIYGNLNRYIFKKILTPALQDPKQKEEAEPLAQKQAAINHKVFEVSSEPVGAPPHPGWQKYKDSMQEILKKQEKLLPRLKPFLNQKTNQAWEPTEKDLYNYLSRIREELQFPGRLIDFKAHMLERLGLAEQEAGNWAQAGKSFSQALKINKQLNRQQNMIRNQRSVAYAAYMLAGQKSGKQKERLLEQALKGFKQHAELIETYGVSRKEKEKQGEGLINIQLKVSLDEAAGTQAASGFSEQQEIRLGQSFIARIQTELGRLEPAQKILKKQLLAYPQATRIEQKDLYGVSLLSHRTGQLDFALKNPDSAFAEFKRSARLALRLENPVSAAINVVNMGLVLTQSIAMDTATRSERLIQLQHMDRRVSRLLSQKMDILPQQGFAPAYHNRLGTAYLALRAQDRADTLKQTALNLETYQQAGNHFYKGLKLAQKPGLAPSRKLLRLKAALHLNLVSWYTQDGPSDKARQHLQKALQISRQGLIPEFTWRALAGLKRYREGLEVISELTLQELGCGPGELNSAFGPLVAKHLENKELEQAFNLAEHLSELERVQRLSPLVLQPLPQDLSDLLKDLYPRLMNISKLRTELKQAAAKDRDHLQKRLEQEKGLVDQKLGTEQKNLPAFIQELNDPLIREKLLILLGLNSHIQDTADRAAANPDNKLSQKLRKRYKELRRHYRETKQNLQAIWAQGSKGPILQVFFARPIEVIELMENLPPKGSCLRLFPYLEDQRGWPAIAIGPQGVSTRYLKADSEINFKAPGPNILISEYLPGTWKHPLRALSATHLLRSIQSRKPFKRKVLHLAPTFSLPEYFEALDVNSNASQEKILQTASESQSMLSHSQLQLRHSVPTRSGQIARPFAGFALDQGRSLDFSKLQDRLTDLEMLMLSSPAPAYILGQFCSLFQVPTLILPQAAKANPEHLQSFWQAYSRNSSHEALQKGLPETKNSTDWLQLGFWGLEPEQARSLARQRFAQYVRQGVTAYQNGEHTQALNLFEKGLLIASEEEKFSQYTPKLHFYARESAFSLEQMPKALEHARKLAGLYKNTQPDSLEQAKSLLSLGLILSRMEKFEQAIARLKQAVDLMRDLQLGPEQVRALADLGVVLENARNYDQALSNFQKAASLSGRLQAPELRAEQYMHMGRILDLRLSLYARAKEKYARAEEIFRRLNKTGSTAQAVLDQARCSRLLGNFVQAEQALQTALDLAGQIKDPRLVAKISMEKANNAWFQSRYQEAFEFLNQVLQEAQKRNWPLIEVMARNTSGLTWWTLGNNDRALRELQRALKQAKTLKIRQDEVASTLNNLGLVHREMGNFQKALKTLNQALEIDKEIKSAWAIAYDLRNMALTHLRLEEPYAALPLLQEALSTASRISNRINVAKIQLALGQCHAKMQNPHQARKAFKQALKISKSLFLPEVTWRALYGLALLDLKAGELHKARKLLTSSLQIIEDMRAEIKIQQLRDSFISNKMQVYETLVGLYLKLDNPTRAFYTAERSRARNLIDLLGNQSLRFPASLEKELYKRQQNLKARIQEQETLLAQADSPKEQEVYRQGLQDLKDEYRDLLLEIQLQKPELASLVTVSPLKLKGVQKLLEPGVALAAYYLLPDEVLCWLISSDSIAIVRTEINRKELGDEILRFRRTLQNLEPQQAQSRQLHSKLIAPLLPYLDKVQNLGIIPHRSLHYLSFATLQDQQSYFLERQPLFYLPSASVLRYTLKRRTTDKNRQILAIGNPDLGDPALELPFAEHEVSSIKWNFPEVTLLTRERATESWVVENIEDFGIIHLASHGEFDAINPLFSSIKLTQDLQEDGNLEAVEIFGLPIQADLVVLSACQTGLGQVTEGDDVIGLNRAFLYAGTHALISSLWRVSDISSAILMKQFYRQYRVDNKAQSLQQAMQHVKNRYPHPGYWGAFTLVGDYE